MSKRDTRRLLWRWAVLGTWVCLERETGGFRETGGYRKMGSLWRWDALLTDGLSRDMGGLALV